MRHSICSSRGGNPARARSGLRVAPVILALWALGAGASDLAWADLPRLSAGMGAGVGGLRREQAVAGVPYLTESGNPSAATWWLDLTWSSRARWTIGLHAHLLRVAIEDGSRVGTFDLIPVLAQLGVRRPLIGEKFWGFATVGAGFTASRFLPAGNEADWEAIGGGGLRFTRERPFTVAVHAGCDYSLSSELLLEAGAGAVAADSEITYRTARGGRPGQGFTEDASTRISATHLTATLGIRWWFEWW